MTDFDNSPQPIASAKGYLYSSRRRKFWLIFYTILSILAILAFILSFLLDNFQMSINVRPILVIFAMISVSGVQTNTIAGYLLRSSTLHIYDEYILAKQVGAKEAKQVVYGSILSVKSRGKKTLNIELDTDVNSTNMYLHLEDTDVKYLAQLIEERRLKAEEEIKARKKAAKPAIPSAQTTNFDVDSTQLIASATGQRNDSFWREVWLGLSIILSVIFLANLIMGVGLDILRLHFLTHPVFIIVMIACIYMAFRTYSSMYQLRQHTILHIYSTHIKGKWAGVLDAEVIEYQRILSVKQCDSELLKITLDTKDDFITVRFYFEKENAEYFAQLIEKGRQVAAGNDA